MGFTDKISALIFALIIIGVFVYLIMSRFVTGPIADLKRGEQIILLLSIIGMLMVVVFAGFELLLHVVV